MVSELSLPEFEAGLSASLTCKRNFACFATFAGEIIGALRGSRLRVQLLEDFSTIGKDSVLSGELQVLVLATMQELPPREQNEVARWLRALRKVHPGLVCIATIGAHENGGPGMTNFLRRQFWFATRGPKRACGALRLPKRAAFTVHPAVHRYVLDVLVHIRMHRLLDHSQAGGASSSSAEDVLDLCRWLCSANHPEKTFVTPDDVQQACAWYFPMHLDVIRLPQQEASVLYGTSMKFAEDLLIGLRTFLKKTGTVDNPLLLETLIVQEVLGKVVPAI
ncbi:ABL031Wp [Eremothecium gossypii ATCC 10895]|uniref:Maintenance of telomere capping protein 2 n=1 Tax=Eremothecium gossypii (strain ATCC 10895 / CBS 109.51 / FGSC 9923 / NRRL Y-1056) TaxID=284811 RepID=MTC2_EREGS|nr:ABL031Wp [Eremothecium gossypii ATCC 10895]Q75DP8.2 RecName: Full=Maintenance of telomere capping protein 2 [Eremothecium gossypii ATCC 10895]AAS50740.2 ABL031Wp [Eremothecium gossypii ATCC 10895]AEY95029.1 FABL031Wp [Eremothecium gossypii FDAG1]